jgi:hypothetical protein
MEEVSGMGIGVYSSIRKQAIVRIFDVVAT